MCTLEVEFERIDLRTNMQRYMQKSLTQNVAVSEMKESLCKPFTTDSSL